MNLLHLGRDVSLLAIAPRLTPLIKAFHAKSRIPWSVTHTLQALPLLPNDPSHEFLIAEEDGVLVGYLWTEIQANRDLWVHEVYAPSGELSKVFWDHARHLAKQSGCTRVAGMFYRGLRHATIYCEKFGLRIAAVQVELPVDGGNAVWAADPGKATPGRPSAHRAGSTRLRLERAPRVS